MDTATILDGNEHADIAAASQGRARVWPGGARQLNLALSGLLALACAVLAFRYAYDTPYWDEWVYVGPIAHAFSGEISLGDFWVRVNEHVYVVSSLLIIPLARLTHWDMRYEIALILAFYAGTFAFLFAALRRAERDSGSTGSLWAAPAIALLLFSPSQHALWNWGLHVSIATAVFSLVAGLWLLSLRASWLTLSAACVFGWMATFSIGGGLSVWPAGVLALLVRPGLDARRRIPYLASWLAAGIAASALYVSGGSSVPADAADRATDMLGVAVYVLAYLGGPLSPFNGPLAIAWGVTWILMTGLLAFPAWRPRRSVKLESFLIGLASVGFTVGILTALKHAHEGPSNAISSRFLPWPTLSWCACLIALYVRYRYLTKAPRAVWLVLAVGAVSALAGWGFGAYKADERHDAFALGRQALIDGSGDPDVAFLHPDPETVAALRPLLVEHRLTVFRGAP